MSEDVKDYQKLNQRRDEFNFMQNRIEQARRNVEALTKMMAYNSIETYVKEDEFRKSLSLNIKTMNEVKNLK